MLKLLMILMSRVKMIKTVKKIKFKTKISKNILKLILFK